MRDGLMICVAGRAGDGSYSAASVFAKALQRRGYYVHEQRKVWSNIQGKPSAFFVVVNDIPVYGLCDFVDILLALDGESFREEHGAVRDGGVVIVDSSRVNPSPKGRPVALTNRERETLSSRRITLLEIPMAEMARGLVKDTKMRNMIGLGILAACANLPASSIADFIQKQFGSKKRGAEIVAQNLSAFDAGHAWAQEQKAKSLRSFRQRQNPGRIYLLGNEAIALGALAGGCRFFAGYPITPASEIFEYMMDHMRELNGVVIQATSELDAVTLAVGASYAGARAMTATAGPGFSLMQEAISGAGCAEVPLVIALVQRGGPGTGLPTRTAQEDLLEAVFGGHGEFPRIVLSPSTPEECFLFAAEAFNLAERYQCLVILLSEQCVGQGRYTIDALPLNQVRIDRGKLLTAEELGAIVVSDNEYERYAVTEDGISRRAFPGTLGITVRVNSNEHDSCGYSAEDVTTRVAQVEKRMRKVATMRGEGFLLAPVIEGDERARMGFIGYGGAYGPVRDAMKAFARKRRIATKFLRLRTLYPFPGENVRAFVDSCDLVFVVEQNATGQLKRLMQMEATGPNQKLKSILRFDGRPFLPSDIVTAARNELHKGGRTDG